MARPKRDVRKAAAADSLYEACQIAEMCLKAIAERLSAKSNERKAAAVAMRILSKAMREYEGPEFKPEQLTEQL